MIEPLSSTVETIKGVTDIIQSVKGEIQELEQSVRGFLGLDQQDEILKRTISEQDKLRIDIEGSNRIVSAMVENIRNDLESKGLSNENLSVLFSENTLEKNIYNFWEEQQIIRLKYRELENNHSQELKDQYDDLVLGLKKAFEIYDHDYTIQNILYTNLYNVLPENHPDKSYYKGLSEYAHKQDLHTLSGQKFVPSTIDPHLVTQTEQKETDTSLVGKLITTAQEEVGVTEGTANKYFRYLGMKNNATNTAWCGSFIGWVLKKNGLEYPNIPTRAKSYANLGQGSGHVAMKTDTTNVVHGNYGDKVAKTPGKKVKMKIIAYTTLSKTGVRKDNKVEKGKNMRFEDVPVGAIIVYDRTKKDTIAA